jgi:hypothetical protein
MVGNQEVAAQLQEAIETAARCASEETSQNYDDLAQDLADLEKVAKEACAEHADSKALIAKLRAGAALSADDLATLRLLMVGDADYYIKYDEELDRCKTEVVKIIAEMQRVQASELTADAMMHLSVLSLEARLLLELTRHYFEARDRVARFDTATSVAIDRDAASALVRILEGMTA